MYRVCQTCNGGDEGGRDDEVISSLKSKASATVDYPIHHTAIPFISNTPCPYTRSVISLLATKWKGHEKNLSEQLDELKPYQQQVYDTSFKSLLQNQIVEKLSFFLEGIENAKELSEKALKPSLNVDSAYSIEQDGVEKILHIEFETDPTNEMSHRMLEYYGILYRKYKKTIISLVVCPFRTYIKDPPLLITNNGEEIPVFHYQVVRLWLFKARKYLDRHMVIMYALLPAMDGANYEILSRALDEMKEYYEGQPKTLGTHLLWFDTFLSRTDTVTLEDKGRVKNKMEQFDSLLEQSPYVQKKSAEAEERGIVEGLQKAIVIIIKRRFPKLAELAQQQVTQINKPDFLDYLIEQVSTASDEEMIRQLLRPSAA